MISDIIYYIRARAAQDAAGAPNAYDLEVNQMDYSYDRRNALWYRQSARKWTEALPVGNGRIGAMLFGGVACERIALNEDSLWSGYPKDKNNPDAHKYYAQAQQLAQSGQLAQAQRLIEDRLEGAFTESYMPLGDIYIEFSGVDECRNYTHLLDLRSGLDICEFDSAGAHIRRTAFASYPDQVFVLRCESSQPGRINFKLRFETQLRAQASAQAGSITVDLRAPSHVDPNYVDSPDPVIYSDAPAEMGMRCRARILVSAEGGSVGCDDGRICVAGADSALLILAVRTSFNGPARQPELEGRDEKADVERDLSAIAGFSFDRLLERHLSDFVPLFDRVRFELNGPVDDIPTDERLRRFLDSPDDRALYELIFHYGRYLMFCSSRPGTRAANLQGIWNPHLRAPWSSNYTVNINTEMNYWPAEICGMGDMHMPLMDLVDALRVTGRETARLHYAARGVVSHHNVDIWALSNPVGDCGRNTAGYAFWPMSFGWLCRHMVEHYDYTLDDAFLRERVLPALDDCVEFFLDILYENADGQLVITPATSPENSFIYEGERISVAKSCAMSSAIVFETFENYLRLSGVAGHTGELADRVRAALPRLKRFDIGTKGQLLEWDSEYEEAEPHHRHTSHLYALHPARLITPESGRPSGANCPAEYRSAIDDQPELANACRTSLNLRGDDGTGWALGWKINHWARLMDGDHALKLLKRQLRLVDDGGFNYSSGGGTYANMFDAHPPFQIDGNFGACAGIAEMFCQGYRGNLLLLPALPGEWKSGHMHGLCAPGRLTVDIDFENGRLKLARIYASRDLKQPLRVVYDDMVKYLNIAAGRTYELRAGDFK